MCNGVEHTHYLFRIIIPFASEIPWQNSVKPLMPSELNNDRSTIPPNTMLYIDIYTLSIKHEKKFNIMLP